MANYQWNVAGSYYFGLFPGPTGPPNQDPNPAATLISSSSVGADVTASDNPSQIEPAVPYQQPDVAAPAANPAITISGAAPPNQIEVEEGVNYIQQDTEAPTANPQVTVGGFVNGNPMSL